MIDALAAQFEQVGVPPEHLHFEDFRLRGRQHSSRGRRVPKP
jgi:hypothetical protein